MANNSSQKTPKANVGGRIAPKKPILVVRDNTPKEKKTGETRQSKFDDWRHIG